MRASFRLLAVPAFALLSLAPSAALAQIHQPGSQPVGSTDEGALTREILSNNTCIRCHSGYASDGDYEPFDSWRGSMMGNAERDPVARAALAIAEVDVDDASDFCVRCHSPYTWYNGGSSAPDYDVATSTPRFAADEPGRNSPDLDGVACMSCHRSLDPGDAQISNTQMVLTDDDVRFGPYTYAEGVDPRHPTEVSTFLPESRLCGQCHDIHNPLHDGYRMDASGVAQPTGRRFVIERTYSEWLYSRFSATEGGQTCQGCHMPEVDHAVTAASELGILRPQMSRHDLAGGSVWQPLAILAALPDAEEPDMIAAYTASSDRARAMLESAAQLELLASSFEGASATASFRVTNLSGHKLPTGYPEGRRMWLEIEVVDASDRVVAASAFYDDATDTLVEDGQARIYRTELGVRQPDGSVTPSFHFILGDTVIRDTRIPPEGFTAPEELDIAPLGADYTNDDGSYRHYDEPSYAFDGLCGTGTLRLRAWLRYQSNSREYMEFLRDQTPASLDPALAGRSWGQVAYDAWRANGGDVPIDMETVEVELGASPGACPEPDAAVDPDAAVAPDAASDDAGVALDAASGGGSSSGCGCTVPAGRGGAAPAFALLVALGLVIRRRRR